MAVIDRNISKFDDNKRGLAKLMAKENISVQILDGVPTATFDVVSRVLTLPNWPFANVNTLDSLIGHEIGHALYTDHSYLERYAKKNGGIQGRLFSYVNAVEDARIERKIREAYPGMKSVFYEGYKDFADHGPVLKVEQRRYIVVEHEGQTRRLAVKGMSLIDRINLHYKIGAFVDVPFSPEELPWLDKIDRCFSTTNACEIAEQLYKLAKEQEERRREEQRKRDEEKKKQPKQQKSKDKSQSAGESSDEAGDGEGDEADDADSKSGKSKKSKSKDAKDAKDKKGGKGEKDKGEKDESGDAPTADDSADETGTADAEGDEDGEQDSAQGGDAEDAGDDAEGTGEGAGDDADDAEDGDEAGSGGSDGGDEGDEDGESAGSGGSGDADGDEDDEDGDGNRGSSGDDAGDADGDADGEHDGGDMEGGSNQRGSGDNTAESEPEGSITDKAITEGLQKLVEQTATRAQGIKHLLLKPLPDDYVAKHILTADVWTQSDKALMSASNNGTGDALLKVAEAEWNAKFLATARHMAAEFDRRKSAKNMMHARTGKTGRLDLNKLYAYKVSDDLFKRVTSVPNGQSHGIVMMIDGSGSMQAVFSSVLDQVLLFGHFAFMANIPFEAYMFSDRARLNLVSPKLGQNTIQPSPYCDLLGLIDTTSRSGFKAQVKHVLALQSRYDGSNRLVEVTNSSLGSTPLLNGMYLIERRVAHMKEKLKLDKVINVVISDGGDTAGLIMESSRVDAFSGAVVPATMGINDTGAAATGVVLRDTVTKKNIVCATPIPHTNSYTIPENALLTALFDTIRDRHDAKNVYMFLVDDAGSGGATAATSMLRPQTTATFSAEDVKKALRKDGQFVVPNSVADLAIVQQTGKLDMGNGSFAGVDTSGMTNAAIGRAFIAHAKQAQANRVFVNTVMPFIA
jgi:hypothetical protein